MEKGSYIEELKPGKPFVDCVFAVKQYAFPESNGKRRATLTLSDRTGTRQAVRWEVTDAEVEILQSSPLVVVTGSLSGPSSSYPNQITLQSIRAHAALPDDALDFLPPLPDDHADTRRRFAALRDGVGNVHLANLLRRVFESEAFQSPFDNAVAASAHHHAFRGGLMRHTVEVAELCQSACAVLPFLRHDLIVAGALLHDIGKIVEMDHGLRAGTYTPLGALVGHVHQGAFFVQMEITRDPAFPEGLRDALTHLLLAHHDRAEWGSPKEPALPEAIVLALCDRISAHATQAADACEAARGTSQISVRRGDRSICVADLGLEHLDLQGLPEPLSAETDALTLDTLPPSRRDSLLPPGTTAMLSLRGLVAAGDGERSAEYPEDTGEQIAVVVPPGGADYLVRVEGESMVGAGILPGDRAYVRHQATARSGEVVVAYLPGSGNVIKRLGFASGKPALLSENPDAKKYPPIPITLETQIQGVVTRVERDLLARV